MGDVTFWTGPISYALTKDAVVPGSEHKVIECRGSGFTPLCRELSASLLDVNGRRLPNLLIKLKVDVEHMRDLVLAAFSNGGVLLRGIVSHPDDRAMIRAVMLADATYADWGLDKKPLISKDWLTWGTEVANGNGKLWVATASPIPDQTRPSGVQVLQEMRAQLEQKVGRSFEPIPDFFGIDPKPDAAYRLGNVVFAEYPKSPVEHGGHVDLAKQTFAKILVPWLAAGGTFEPEVVPPPGPPPEPPPAATEQPPAAQEDWERWLLFGMCAVGAAAAAYSIVDWYRGRRTR